MKITSLDIDLRKNLYQLHGIDERGKVIQLGNITWTKLLKIIKLQGFLIGTEVASASTIGPGYLKCLVTQTSSWAPSFLNLT